MTDGNELLKAIAEAGGLDPFDVLDHMVSPSRSNRPIDKRDGLLREVLAFISSNRNKEDDNRVKQILWDARAATLVSDKFTADEKAERLEALDEIGTALFRE
jgi:hypothetical protein